MLVAKNSRTRISARSPAAATSAGTGGAASIAPAPALAIGTGSLPRQEKIHQLLAHMKIGRSERRHRGRKLDETAPRGREAPASRYFGRSPDRLDLEDVRAFQVHLVSTGISRPSLNQTVCALRFFYGVTILSQ